METAATKPVIVSIRPVILIVTYLINPMKTVNALASSADNVSSLFSSLPALCSKATRLVGPTGSETGCVLFGIRNER
jgi:hypothetical protein